MNTSIIRVWGRKGVEIFKNSTDLQCVYHGQICRKVFIFSIVWFVTQHESQQKVKSDNLFNFFFHYRHTWWEEETVKTGGKKWIGKFIRPNFLHSIKFWMEEGGAEGSMYVRESCQKRLRWILCFKKCSLNPVIHADPTQIFSRESDSLMKYPVSILNSQHESFFLICTLQKPRYTHYSTQYDDTMHV